MDITDIISEPKTRGTKRRSTSQKNAAILKFHPFCAAEWSSKISTMGMLICMFDVVKMELFTLVFIRVSISAKSEIKEDSQIWKMSVELAFDQKILESFLLSDNYFFAIKCLHLFWKWFYRIFRYKNGFILSLCSFFGMEPFFWFNIITLKKIHDFRRLSSFPS